MLLRDIRNKIIRILHFLILLKNCHGARTSFQRSHFQSSMDFFSSALDTILQGIYVNQRVEIYRYMLLYSSIYTVYYVLTRHVTAARGCAFASFNGDVLNLSLHAIP